MNRKKKNLIILIVVFAVITAAGAIYSFAFQKKDINKKQEKINSLKASYSSIGSLKAQLSELELKVKSVDSLLFSDRFVIPKSITQSRFFNFIDSYSRDYGLTSYTNTEFLSTGVESGFNYYLYKVSGNGEFENVYGLIYAIEHSKELKKVQKADFGNTISVSSKGEPKYLTKFEIEVKVYFSSNDQYAAVNFVENNLGISTMHDAFYPLVRNEISPNTANLPDIQDATLLSLVPQGAFITDASGNTTLMSEGDPVYLGYLMKIDYEKESVTFVLNRGGLVEYITLTIGKNNKKEGK
ncbi:MAG TPA: hypothetical protein VFF33_04700 [Ignavibacteriaceae bacterium]|nr:hypothetical protein [Ignavibacteriaceae bacterium]